MVIRSIGISIHILWLQISFEKNRIGCYDCKLFYMADGSQESVPYPANALMFFVAVGFVKAT